jgi:hypothetical protein
MTSRTSSLPHIISLSLVVLACIFFVIGLVRIFSDAYLNVEAIAYLFDGVLFLVSGVLIFFSIRAFRKKYNNS